MAPVQTQRTFSAGSEFPETTPDLLRIYSMRFCPFAQRALLVLAHKNVKHETVNVNLKKKPDWFLARNPFGLVPTLELNGKVLYESTAVCDWLDEVYPQNKLTPTDPDRKARDRMLLENFGKLVSASYAIRTGDAEKIEDSLKLLHKMYKYYEDALAKRGSRYFGGDQPAMFDFLIWPFMERIPALLVPTVPRAAIAKEEFPLLAGWYSTMYDTPAVKATMLDKETHQKFISKIYAEGDDLDYDFYLEE